MSFQFTKDGVGERSTAILEAVDKQMAKAWAIKDEVGGSIVYTIPLFAPLRYSMFAPFSKVVVTCDAARCSLTLRPGYHFWLLFLFGVAAVALFGLSGPLTTEGVALLLGMPIAVFALSLADGLTRTSRWWRRL